MNLYLTIRDINGNVLLNKKPFSCPEKNAKMAVEQQYLSICKKDYLSTTYCSLEVFNMDEAGEYHPVNVEELHQEEDSVSWFKEFHHKLVSELMISNDKAYQITALCSEESQRSYLKGYNDGFSAALHHKGNTDK